MNHAPAERDDALPLDSHFDSSFPNPSQAPVPSGLGDPGPAPDAGEPVDPTPARGDGAEAQDGATGPEQASSQGATAKKRRRRARKPTASATTVASGEGDERIGEAPSDAPGGADGDGDGDGDGEARAVEVGEPVQKKRRRRSRKGRRTPREDGEVAGEDAAGGDVAGGDVAGGEDRGAFETQDPEAGEAEPDGDRGAQPSAPPRRGGSGRARGERAPGGELAAQALWDDGAEGELDGAELDGEAADSPVSSEQPEPGDGAPRKKRSRRSRRRRRRSGEAPREEQAEGDEPRSADSAGDANGEPEPASDQGGGARSPLGGSRRKRRSKRGRGKGGRRDDREGEDRGGEDRSVPAPDLPAPLGIEVIPGEEDDLAELDPLPPRAKGRRRAAERDPDEAPAAVEVPRDQRILVNAADPEESRVVVVEGPKIVDLQMTVRDHESYVNDIYRGRVVNLEPAIGAAFVDFGQGRNGFLHVSDVMEVYGEKDWSLDKLLTARTAPEDWGDQGKAEELEGDEKREAEGPASEKRASGKRDGGKSAKGKPRARSGKRHNIGDLLQKGQTVAVQITKDAIGDKGPTLTTFISIPGRYLVLMPSLQRTGVSRKIEDEKERRRLKRILQSLEIPDSMGVIVRTAGVGRSKSDIKRDLDYLVAVWEDFSKKLVLGRNPAPLYQESDVAIRTMRDLFGARTETVVVDSPKVFEHMREFTQKLMPEHVDRIVLHEAPKPLFHHYGIEADFERIFARRVELPSGGSIVIDQTEALVAIDVNSGRTRDEGADFEDIALKTNLEAAPEIARQIRLRDMGGILVVDFIDMMRQSSRKLVERVLKEALATDRARSKVGRISQFGLLELTRQRLGPGLSRLVYDTCPACKGSGRRRTAQSRAQAVLRRLSSALTQKGFTKIEVVCHHDTVAWLQKRNRTELAELEERGKREIALKGVEEQAEESVFHYLRADGREVRPGGRRKR